VRVRDGVPAITDGPFAEAKEQLAGYLMVECASLERATTIAARWPARTLARAPIGPYQLQAAIAAVHAEAARAEDTDWAQLLALYELLERISPNPMVTLNRAVAVAMAHGPRAGLDLLATLDADERLARHHRLAAVRAHLLEMAGDHQAARSCYQLAARRTTSLPERRYLEARAARLA
jgi:predicted RNA polymerase sigma factor